MSLQNRSLIPLGFWKADPEPLKLEPEERHQYFTQSRSRISSVADPDDF
jgi:hypothetical protein